LAEYRNPQQESGGDKRMLWVFAVTFALIIIGQIFLFKKTPPKSDASPATPNSAQTTQATTPATVTTPAPSETQTAATGAATPVESKSASA